MTIRCTQCGGERFRDSDLIGDARGQQSLPYVCVECGARGEIIYDNTAEPALGQSDRWLRGSIEEGRD
jgi:DNA-directed RNA polymerase subunit RPC12/RpoP